MWIACGYFIASSALLCKSFRACLPFGGTQNADPQYPLRKPVTILKHLHQAHPKQGSAVHRLLQASGSARQQPLQNQATPDSGGWATTLRPPLVIQHWTLWNLYRSRTHPTTNPEIVDFSPWPTGILWEVVDPYDNQWFSLNIIGFWWFSWFSITFLK